MESVARGSGGSAGSNFAALFTPKLFTVLREGYGLADFRADALAGLTVAVVALPLSMAIAIASGVTPDRGLYTAIVGGFLVSALGGSRFQIGGPAGAFIVLVASTVAAHGVEGLILATMISGLIMAIVGLLRLGSYVKFIPYPVTVGFTAGIAVIIFASQIKDLLGLTVAGKEPGPILPKLQVLAASLPTVTPAAVAVSAATVLIIVGVKKLRPGWPGMIIAIAVAATAAALLGLPVETIGSRFGAMPASLPLPALPDVTFSKVAAILPNAIAFALLGSIESLLSAVVADGMTGRRHRSNCELVAQGVANIGSGLFGGICVTGTIARTVTNVRAGAHGPIAGMMHSLFLLLFLLVAAPLAAYVPLAALAGVLAVVAWNMAEKHEFATLLRASKGDALVLLATFLLTVFRDLTEGIVVGFTIGALLFIHRMAENAGVQADVPVPLDDVPDEIEDRGRFDAGLASDPDLVVYRISGALFFGAASTVGAVLDRIADQRKAFVIDFSAVALLDSTGAHAIEGAARKAARRNVAMFVTGASPATRHMLVTHGVREPLVRYRASIADAVDEIRNKDLPV
ncbi:MAG: STAS domain-containing protein [Rhodobiaceae bacterium]|nr:STAS domain-containing protein [Rhodobiaceae bacterium]MCC0054656.1 STAS domain-containing protein [Rhodobiaceae bacterium]